MKRIVPFLLSLALFAALVPSAIAASGEAVNAANALYELGLFKGTGTDANGSPNFDLDRAPTRYEAVTMLVRLLGKESEALNGTWTTPFADVADWAKPYVGYAYAHGLTAGSGDGTTYSGPELASVSQYLTFVLRALGYESGTDFQWDKAWELSDKIGLTNGQYNANTVNFTRGDVTIISESALSAKEKGTNNSLLSQLVASDAVTESAANNYLHPVHSIALSQSSVKVTVGKSTTITATVSPSDAADKTVTWASSNSSVASVANGTITGISVGTATITATTNNGKTATCAVTVEEAPPFVVPEVGKEYGPMTVTSYYSSGRYWYSNMITSLVFTSVELSRSSGYKVTLSMQGITEYSRADVYVYFYDANNRVLDKVHFSESVASNIEYNIQDYTYINQAVVENATRIKFYSNSGHAAVAGTSSNITIVQDGETLYPGDTMQLTAITIPGNLSNSVSWSSNDTSIAMVSSSGLVTGVKQGTCEIVATLPDGSSATHTITVSKTPVEIILKDSLPKTLSYYNSRDVIQNTWNVTDFRYEVETSSYRTSCTVYFYLAGVKTYDVNGSGQGTTCRISWQLYDEDGYVVDSGTVYSPSVRMGDKFRDAKGSIYSLEPGTYYLSLSSTN